MVMDCIDRRSITLIANRNTHTWPENVEQWVDPEVYKHEAVRKFKETIEPILHMQRLARIAGIKKYTQRIQSVVKCARRKGQADHPHVTH
jgi:hypothetical protein